MTQRARSSQSLSMPFVVFVASSRGGEGVQQDTDLSHTDIVYPQVLIHKNYFPFKIHYYPYINYLFFKKLFSIAYRKIAQLWVWISASSAKFSSSSAQVQLKSCSSFNKVLLKALLKLCFKVALRNLIYNDL